MSIERQEGRQTPRIFECFGLYALERAVYDGIARNRGKSDIDIPYIRGSENIASLVHDTFVRLREELHENSLRPEQLADTQSYRDVVFLFGIAGITRPITAGDWSVERVVAAEQLLGLQSFAKFEKILGEKYGMDERAEDTAPFRHLHKGPGNGILMEHLRSDTSQTMFTGTAREGPTSKHWEEWGIGDYLYFAAERVLQQFVRPEKRDDPVTQLFLEKLGLALRRALKNKWFEAKGNVVRHWEPKVDFFDLNIIFELLAHPKQWLPEWHKGTKGKYISSGEFEDDTVEEVDEQVNTMLLQYQGWSQQELLVQFITWKTSRLREEKTTKGQKLQLLYLLNKKLRQAQYDVTRGKILESVSMDELWNEWTKCTGRQKMQGGTLNALLQKVAWAIEEARAEIKNIHKAFELLTTKNMPFSMIGSSLFSIQRHNELEQLYRHIRTLSVSISQDAIDYFAKQVADLMESEPTPGLTIEQLKEKVERILEELQQKLPEEPAQPGRLSADGLRFLLDLFRRGDPHRMWRTTPDIFLRHIFNKEFGRAVKHRDVYQKPDYHELKTYPGTEDPILDLNKYPVVHIDNFVPGLFCDAKNYFPPESFFLITGERSDSHEPSEPFEQDITYNLAMLKPGGILLTDGLRESYTRIYRIQEIQNAIGNRRKEFKAEIVTAPPLRKPLAILIQRAHPEKGFLTDEEKRYCFREDVEFEDIGEFSRRPDISILNSVRKKILAIAQDDVTIFDKLHDQVRLRLERLFIGAGIEKLMDVYHADTRAALLEVLMVENDEELGKWISESIRRPSNGSPLFDRQEVKGIEKKFTEELEEVVRRTQKAALAFLPLTLEALQPRTLHTFPRLHGVRKEDMYRFNSHCEFPIERLSDNKEFQAPQICSAREQKITHINSNLQTLYRRFGAAPVALIDFADCSTNDLLREKLMELVGPDLFPELVNVIKIDFDPRVVGRERETLIRHYKAVELQFKKFMQHGGVVIGGGSWFDAYDQRGKFWKREIGHHFVEAMEKRISPLRMLAICFSCQTMADIIGKKYCHDQVDTKPGMLEFGPTPVRIETEHLRNPLFADFPVRDFTMAMTHSGHVIDDRNGRAYIDTLRFLEPMATSRLTGLPVVWSGLGGKILCIQGHPELDLVSQNQPSPDIERIMNEFRRFRTGIENTFGLDPEIFQQNWDQAKISGVMENAGSHLLVNGLLALTQNLI